MKIGKHLLNKRHQKRLSQQEVADYLNISQRTYSNFESDNSAPSIKQIVALNNLFEFDFLKLYTGLYF
jgi:transcriptional regulator with XRE-family HTH domain